MIPLGLSGCGLFFGDVEGTTSTSGTGAGTAGTGAGGEGGKGAAGECTKPRLGADWVQSFAGAQAEDALLVGGDLVVVGTAVGGDGCELIEGATEGERTVLVRFRASDGELLAVLDLGPAPIGLPGPVSLSRGEHAAGPHVAWISGSGPQLTLCVSSLAALDGPTPVTAEQPCGPMPAFRAKPTTAIQQIVVAASSPPVVGFAAMAAGTLNETAPELNTVESVYGANKFRFVRLGPNPTGFFGGSAMGGILSISASHVEMVGMNGGVTLSGRCDQADLGDMSCPAHTYFSRLFDPVGAVISVSTLIATGEVTLDTQRLVPAPQGPAFGYSPGGSEAIGWANGWGEIESSPVVSNGAPTPTVVDAAHDAPASGVAFAGVLGGSIEAAECLPGGCPFWAVGRGSMLAAESFVVEGGTCGEPGQGRVKGLAIDGTADPGRAFLAGTYSCGAIDFGGARTFRAGVAKAMFVTSRPKL